MFTQTQSFQRFDWVTEKFRINFDQKTLLQVLQKSRYKNLTPIR